MNWGHLVQGACEQYEFIEQDEPAADYLLSRLPDAKRQTLESADDSGYDWVFAIDSLEHNDNYPELLQRLAEKLTPDGILVLSGPTENSLYKLGRRIAGFSGDYHKTNIYDIEKAASKHLRLIQSLSIFPGVPFFSLTAWTKA